MQLVSIEHKKRNWSFQFRNVAITGIKPMLLTFTETGINSIQLTPKLHSHTLDHNFLLRLIHLRPSNHPTEKKPIPVLTAN